MRRSTLSIIVVVILLILAGAYYVLSVQNSRVNVPIQSPPAQIQKPKTSPTPTPTIIPGTIVSISNFSFSPSVLTVRRGLTVTWVNNDNVQHQIVNDPNGDMFMSQSLSPGQIYTYTFNNPGRYPYHCAIHPYMKGTIVVK